MSIPPKSPPHLKGKRILVTALDLEQQEHRGIAVYSKALIRHLRRLGAEVWLLTQFKPMTSDLRQLPKETQRIIYSSRTLNELVHGKTLHLSKLEQIIPFLAKFGNRYRRMRKSLKGIFVKTSYQSKDLRSFKLNELRDNPNLRINRLDYLQDVEGIVSLDDVYEASQLSALKKQRKPVSIDLKGFDAFITCCPLNLRPKNTPRFIQTVHDLIALEYAPHNENMRQFTHRLQACLPAQRIHVSNSTCRKFHDHIKVNAIEVPLGGEETVVQPPSLYLPSPQRNAGEHANDLPPSSHLLRNDRSDNRGGTLQPFRYMLFNSSVEARKNLLFLVKAFAQSGLGREGIRLCVTGKLKSDSYSKAVKEVVANEPAILLTGYVDEATKLDLYLNALALLSPSLVEGFGIPVLDAACLGLPALASSCDAHREIHDLFDFCNYVLPISILETRDWSAAMQATTSLNSHLVNEPEEERMRRLRRYLHTSAQIEERFENQIAQLLLG